MLSISDQDLSLRRRQFLKIGGLGLGGLTLSQLLAAREAAGIGQLHSDRSVIFLFLHGGPSQTETFDPKPNAPAGIRSATGDISTSIPGLRFGATFPKLASRSHLFSIVRSFQTGDGNHDIKPIVGRDSGGANLGSIYARVAGTNHPVTGMPRNVALFPRAVAPDSQPENNNFGRFTSTGALGSAYAPFVPGAGGNAQADMQLMISRQRLDDRRNLLGELDRVKQAINGEGLAGDDRLNRQAFETIVGGVANAFDLSNENQKVIESYDTAPLVRPENISRKWRNYNNYVDNAQSLGKLLLLARRLCESGCGFVTVTTNFVWDMHSDVNNAGVEEGMQYMGLPLDHALSALIDDLESRGLRDKVMVVACGEMGRTPKINARGGRDHWGGLAPLLIYGGGLKMGQVIGESNADASRPAADPMNNQNLIATVMHQLMDVGQLRTVAGLPQDVMRAVTAAEPIPGLL